MTNIINEVNKILVSQNETSTTILEIFKTGSQLFIENPSDLDYVVICENYKNGRTRLHKEIEGYKYDFIIIDKSILAKQINLDDRTLAVEMKLFNYLFIVKETIYGSYDLNWNMLEYREKYLSILKEIYVNTIGKLIVKTKFTKLYTHYYLIISMFENNSTEVTAEMLENVKILYAGGEPVLELVQWIEDKLNIKE